VLHDQFVSVTDRVIGDRITTVLRHWNSGRKTDGAFQVFAAVTL
jgi:hypothetical protein